MTEQEVLRRFGMDAAGGWSVQSRTPETHEVPVFDRDQKATGEKRSEPTGNVVWIATNGQGLSRTLIVKVGGTGGSSANYTYEVVEPPKDLPTPPRNSTAPQTTKVGDTTYQWDGTKWAPAPGLPTAPSTAKPSDPSRLQVINDPTTGRPIKLRDPATGTVIDLPDAKDPAKPQIVNGLRGEILQIADGKVTVLRAGEPKDPPAPQAPHTITAGDGSVWQWDPAAQKWNPTGIAGKPASVQTATDAKGQVWERDAATGEWKPVQGPATKGPQAIKAGTDEQYIVSQGADGAITNTPNANFQQVDPALFDFFGTLKEKLGSGLIPLETAKALAQSAYQAYTARTSAEQTASNVGKVAGDYAEHVNDMTVSPGTSAYVNAQRAGDRSVAAPGALTTGMLPYDAQKVAHDAAAATLARISPAAQAHQASSSPTAGTPFQAPTSSVAPAPKTTIKPDGTVTVEHVGGGAPAPVDLPGFRAPQMANDTNLAPAGRGPLM